MNQEVIVDALVFIFTGLGIADWIAAVILWRASRQHPDVVALRERGQAAVAIAVGTTVAVSLGYNSLLGLHLAVFPITTAIFALALGVVSATSLRWLWLYLRDGF